MNFIRRPLRMALYVDGGVLLLTGILWAVLHYRPQWLRLTERDATTANVMLMQVHGAAAMLALVLLGTLLSGHVRTGWRSARNKASGISTLSIGAVLAVTGYLLYYAGAEATRQAASLLHLGAGAALPVAVIAHAIRQMRARRRHAGLARALHHRKRTAERAG